MWNHLKKMANNFIPQWLNPWKTINKQMTYFQLKTRYFPGRPKLGISFLKLGYKLMRYTKINNYYTS